MEKQAKETTKPKSDAWRKEFGFVDAKIDFEFHLDENDVKDAERIDENVRIIEINNVGIEFGFEDEFRKDGKIMVKINLGFAHALIPKSEFEKALMHYRLVNNVGREKLIERALKQGAR